jgi:nitrite reductase/ring-hydroxylating ferredoxin subunit
VTGAVTGLIGLHIAAALKDLKARRASVRTDDGNRWIHVSAIGEIPNGRAVIVRPPLGAPIAVFNDNGSYAALGNHCAHQNGPLGEGRIINGCAVCPWHGYEYQLTNGRAPPPHSETVPTYPLRIADGQLYVDPRPNPPDDPSMPVAPSGATNVRA